MNNFGVIEIASARTTAAPGWAYVPDIGGFPGPNALQPANRKRARNGFAGASSGDLSARQEAKIQKEIEALQRDLGKESSIPVPARSGKAAQKHTAGVRKILQSQKTFANHLDDFAAVQTQAEAATGASGAAGNSRRPANKRETQEEDVPMTETDAAPLLVVSAPAAQDGDANPLLASRVPPMPTDEELRRLLAHPPLTYHEAKGKWEARRPVTAFCEVCGYWGRVKCVKCGTRVCALDCLDLHRQECVTRYGL